MPQWIPSVTALIAACTALIATIVGPLISWNIAKRQIRATTISANRQVWIDTFRNLIAEWVSIIDSSPKGDPYAKMYSDKAVFTREKVKLLINPIEKDHNELLRLLGMVPVVTSMIQEEENGEKEDSLQYRRADYLYKITELTQKILKREWERVKEGD